MSGAGQGYFYSPEDQASLQANQRRAAFAQALMQQGQDPGTAQYGGLRSAGNSILGAFLAKRSDEKQAELAKSAQDKYVQSMSALLKGQPAASTAPATPPGPQQLDPEGNVMAQGQGTPNYQAAPSQPQQPSAAPAPGGGDFLSRLIATGNPGLIQQFAPQILQNQQARENRVWENNLPLSAAKQQESKLELDRQEALSRFNNGLPLTAAQAATLRQQGAMLGETARHNRAEETIAQNPFGVGPTGQAIAQGKTGDEFLSTLPPGVAAQVKAVGTYRQPAPAGRTSPTGIKFMSLVNQAYPSFDASQYGSKVKARNDFTTGKNGNTVRSLNVAVQHLDQLGQLSDAMSNGNMQLANQIGNYYATQTGQPAPSNFNAAKQLVGDEIVKAIVGSGGGVSDREEAAHNISAASSPQQLAGVIKTYQGLLSGQLVGLKQQYEKSTGLQDFEDYLAPETKAKLQAHGTGGIVPPPSAKKTIKFGDLP